MASTASIRPGRPFSEPADITLTLLAATLDPVPVKPIPPVNANYRFDMAGKYLSEKVNITFNQSLVPDLTFSKYLLVLNPSSCGGKYKPIDVLIIPRGIGTRLDRLYPPQPGEQSLQETKEFILNVAPYIRHSIIRYYQFCRFDLVASDRPQVKWLRNQRWVQSLPREKFPDVGDSNSDVDNGMKYFGGKAFARSTARILEYEWTGDGGETAC
ncbi:hypothetical protein V8E54_007368 [Elaphomyces granulatus]